MEEMYLYEMISTYPKRLVVTVIDNGHTIFTGVVDALSKYVNSENLARKAHIYFSDLSYRATVYLQR